MDDDIECVPLDENDINLPVRNHQWMNALKFRDYYKQLGHVGAPRWIQSAHDEFYRVRFEKDDMCMLNKARHIFRRTGTIDINLAIMLMSFVEGIAPFNNDGYIVLHNHGALREYYKPCKNAYSVIESLIASPENIIDVYENMSLFFIPFVDLNEEMKYIVFVRDYTVFMISHACISKENTSLSAWKKGKEVTLIKAWSVIICNFFNDNYSFDESYVAEVFLLTKNESINYSKRIFVTRVYPLTEQHTPHQYRFHWYINNGVPTKNGNLQFRYSDVKLNYRKK